MSNSRQAYIYDLKRLLSKGPVVDESRLNNKHLGFLLDQRRAKEIRDTFKRNPVIETTWLQDYGMIDCTPVNRAEDKSIVTGSDCTFSKIRLPKIISINDPLSNTNDLGTYSIRSFDGRTEYSQISADKIFLLNKDSILSKVPQYCKIGNDVYLTPDARRVRAILILESPLDGFILDNTYQLSGSLVIGTVYIVDSGNITHNAIKYFKGQTFTAVNTVFTGLGKVQFNLQKRQMNNNDPYPMSSTMAEVVKMKILSQDFTFEKSITADSQNDSADDSNV